MRIISKFHDYYDTALSYGVDKTQAIVREPVTEEKELIRGGIRVYLPNWYSLFALGYCGKWYYGVKLYGYPGKSFESGYYFSIEALREGRQEDFSSTFADHLRVGGKIDKWFKGEYTLDPELFFWYKSSLLYCEFGRWNEKQSITTWPCLKDLGFQKIKDPYTAFQDISMYQFGVLGDVDKDTVDISDKDRVAGKGFDTVYGFRKRPGGK